MSLVEVALVLMQSFIYLFIFIENKDDAFSLVFIVDLALILR